MNDIDNVAQRFQIWGDIPLVDYFLAYLPCQLLFIDSLVIERRPLPTPTEFVLKAIQAGLGEGSEIAGLFGLSERYVDKLLAELKREGYVAMDEIGRPKLMRRANEALSANGERVPIDRTINILWDPILGTPITSRPELLTQRVAERSGHIWRLPNSSRQPDLSELSTPDVVAVIGSAFDMRGERDHLEVLRLVALRRTLFRFRPVTVLVYQKEGSAPLFKVATNGHIDDGLSNGLAQRDGAKYIGLDNSFSRKAGAVAVKERHKLLPASGIGKNLINTDMAGLVRQKSSLKFALEILLTRAREDKTPALEQKIKEKASALAEVDQTLASIPVVPVAPYEIPLIVKEAFRASKSILIVTTTIPSANRFSTELFDDLQACIQKGVRVLIYISGRIQDAGGSVDRQPSVLAKLNSLSEKFINLSIYFLRNVQRPVYEVSWDNKVVVFSNDPPLGDRAVPFAPRSFRGYRISGCAQVEFYIKNYLTIHEGDVIHRLRITATKRN